MVCVSHPLTFSRTVVPIIFRFWAEEYRYGQDVASIRLGGIQKDATEPQELPDKAHANPSLFVMDPFIIQKVSAFREA